MKYYINLTNGIEFLNNDYIRKQNISFVRTQSTLIEQKHFNKILEELDYNFLLDVVMGEVIVLDTSQNNVISRALLYGLEYITYVLNRFWLNKQLNNKIFDEYYCQMSDNIKSKLLYIKQYVNVDTIKIIGVCYKQNNDDNFEYFRKILIKNKGD